MRKAIAVVSTAILLAVGSVAVASHNFTDVDEGNIFHDDIAWMYDNGITYGYGDGTYGPKDFMTREQMAAFMHRLYNRIQQDIPELPDGLDVSVSLEEVCALFDAEVGSEACKDALRGDAGPQGPAGPQGLQGKQGEPGLANLSTDGPYPGEGPELQDDSLFLDDGRAEFGVQWESGQLNQSAVRCADGKVAVGGGFRRGDAGDFSALNIVSSHPAYIDSSGTIVSETDAASIALGDTSGTDQDWSFEPNGWVVEGYYDGAGAITVRPFVTCATVAD